MIQEGVMFLADKNAVALCSLKQGSSGKECEWERISQD